MPSTMARARRDGTADQTVTGRAASVAGDVNAQARTTAVDVSAIVANHAPAAVRIVNGETP